MCAGSPCYEISVLELGVMFVLSAADILSGINTPAEKSALNASSTVRLVLVTALSSTNIKNPVVGLGIVGINTLIFFPSPHSEAPVTKPIDLVPSLGKSTRTTRLNACLPGKVTACKTCLTEE